MVAAVVSTAAAFAKSDIPDSLEMDRAGALTVEDLLAGRVSGVRIQEADGGLNTLRNTLIRGINTLHGSGSPLWIVDGAVLSSVQGEQNDMFWQEAFQGQASYMNLSELDVLNLYDIESIEVLKNTAATAIYGERGANGAIIIKTKKGKNGTNVEARSNFGTNSPGFVTNNSVALSTATQRTDYRLSAFLRSSATSTFPERNTTGGASFAMNTKAGTNMSLGLNAKVAIGKQLSGNEAERKADYEDNSSNFRTIESFWSDFKIIEGLNWKTNLSIDYQKRSRSIWYGADTRFGAEVGNAAGISLAVKMLANARTSLEYSRYISQDHHFKISAGGEVYYTSSKYNTLNGTNILVSQLKALGFGYRGSADESALYRNNLTQSGLFATASYDYRKVAGLELVARIDKTSKLENKWNFYPSVSAFLDIKELALGGSPNISSLRLHTGYGKAGLARYVPYHMFPQYTAEQVPAYPKDTWAFLDGWQNVSSKEFNLGLDAAFLSGRVNVSLCYYNRKTDDILYLYNRGVLDEASNLWKYGPGNVDAEYKGKIDSHGVELDLDAILLQAKHYKWTLGLNMTWNKMPDGLPCPKSFGGLSTAVKVHGFTVDVLADCASGNDLGYTRLSRVSCAYDIPISRIKWIRSLAVCMSAGNLFTSDSYKDRIVYPVRKSLVFGIKADF